MRSPCFSARGAYFFRVCRFKYRSRGGERSFVRLDFTSPEEKAIGPSALTRADARMGAPAHGRRREIS